MSEIENKTIIKDDDEISLIDLFAVLIKYRFMICFGTIIAALVVGAYLFVLPKFAKIESVNKEVKIIYSYKINTLPDAIEKAFTSNLEKKNNVKNLVASICEYNLKNTPVLASEIKAYNPFGSSEAQLAEIEYNNFIDSLILSKKYDAKINVIETNVEISINVPRERIDETNNMIDDIIAKTNNEIESYVFPKLDGLEMSVPEALSSIQSGDNSLIAFQMIEENKALIQNFRKSYKSFIEKRSEPFVTSLEAPRSSKAKKLIIVVFAVFFVLVFIAFLLNAIENIKQDPEASDKIKSAWVGGKITKKK